MKSHANLSWRIKVVAGLAVAAILLQLGSLLYGASVQKSPVAEGYRAAIANLLGDRKAGLRLSKEEVRKAVQEALDVELRSPGTSSARREALLALLVEAKGDGAPASPPGDPPISQQQSQQDQPFPPAMPAPPPPPFPRAVFEAPKQNVGYHGYSSHKGGKADKTKHQARGDGIQAWVKRRAEKQANADAAARVRAQVSAGPASSGFPDMAPIAQAQCNLPFDVSGADATTTDVAAGEDQQPPPLTPDLVQAAAQDGIAILSFTNSRTLHMTLNWALHLRLAGVSQGPLVGLMADVDSEGYARCKPYVVPFAAGATRSAGFGNQDEMGAQGGRWMLARAAMQVAVDAGVSLLISDNDVIWLRNPIPYLRAVSAKHPRIDFIISSDAPTSTAKMPFKKDNNYVRVQGVQELGLEDAYVNHAPFNIGIIWFAARQKCVQALQRFVDTVATINEVDQWPINLMLREGMMELIEDRRVTYGESGDRAAYPAAFGNFSMGVFNTMQFSSALVYSVTQSWRIEGLKPYGIHLTYVQNQNLESKIMRAREELMFADPPSFYTKDKLLIYNVELPSKMLQTPDTDRGAFPAHHFALLELQLRHAQAALMIGQALGRAVVLPRLTCTCQNEGIVPHENCRGPGHPTKLPYKCPTDHVFVPMEVVKLGIKAPGFADHPCMPPSFMSDQLKVEVCKARPGTSCPPGSRDAGFATLRAKSTDREVSEQLAQFADINVLVFGNVADAYGGFEASSAAQEFVKIANQSLYKFFTYEPPPSGVPTDPLGPVHIMEFQWPFPWYASQMQGGALAEQ